MRRFEYLLLSFGVLLVAEGVDVDGWLAVVLIFCGAFLLGGYDYLVRRP